MNNRSTTLLNVGFSLDYGAIMFGLMTSSMDIAVDTKRLIFRFLLVPAFLIGAGMIFASHRMDR